MFLPIVSICLFARHYAEGKSVKSAVVLGGLGKQWAYISKFGFYEGKSNYKVRVRSPQLNSIMAQKSPLGEKAPEPGEAISEIFPNQRCSNLAYTHDTTVGCDGWRDLTEDKCWEKCLASEQAAGCPKRTCAAMSYYAEEGWCHHYSSCEALVPGKGGVTRKMESISGTWVLIGGNTQINITQVGNTATLAFGGGIAKGSVKGDRIVWSGVAQGSISILKNGILHGTDGKTWKRLEETCDIYHCPEGYSLKASPEFIIGKATSQCCEVEVLVTVEVYLDTVWGEAEQMPECKRQDKAKKVKEVSLPLDGSWSGWVAGRPTQHIRPHVWYFAIQDCATKLPQDVLVEFEFHAQQENGSEFSVELYGTFLVASITISIGTLWFLWLCRTSLEFRRTNGGLHPVVFTFIIAAVAQYLAYLFHWQHLWVYSGDGRGVKALDALSEVFGMLSQILVTAISVFIAHGYTILPKANVHKAITPIFVILAIVHLAIVGIEKSQDESHFKFHENEGLSGIVLVALRLAMFAWFSTAMWFTYPDAAIKIKPFIQGFQFASSLQFLAYPALFVAAGLCAPYVRHKIMVMGFFLMQAVSLSWYARMFLTRGQYYHISCLGGNFLPTPQGSRRRLYGVGTEKAN